MQQDNDDPLAAFPGWRRFDEWIDNGFLWLINTTVFHPRGYAIGLVHDEDGNVIGWELLGDATEPWQYACDPETQATVKAKFKAIQQHLP